MIENGSLTFWHSGGYREDRKVRCPGREDSSEPNPLRAWSHPLADETG